MIGTSSQPMLGSSELKLNGENQHFGSTSGPWASSHPLCSELSILCYIKKAKHGGLTPFPVRFTVMWVSIAAIWVRCKCLGLISFIQPVLVLRYTRGFWSVARRFWATGSNPCAIQFLHPVSQAVLKPRNYGLWVLSPLRRQSTQDCGLKGRRFDRVLLKL